jgi:hypothetical protein
MRLLWENEQEMEAATLGRLRDTARAQFERISKSLKKNEMALVSVQTCNGHALIMVCMGTGVLGLELGWEKVEMSIIKVQIRVLGKIETKQPITLHSLTTSNTSALESLIRNHSTPPPYQC